MTRFAKVTICLLILSLLSGITACGTSYPTAVLEPDVYLMGEDRAQPTPAVTRTGETAPGDVNTTPQLTQEDILAMNDGDAQFVYNEAGYLTFLNGRYYEEKVDDYEEAVASLNGVASLIGLGAGSEFFGVYGERDDDGYTYYVFQQRYGNVTVQYSTLRVIIDPDGYTAGLSCSFTPNLGIVEVSPTITATQAEDLVRQALSDNDLTYYSDYTTQAAVTIHDITYHVFVVYTSNPDVSADKFDMMYREHFVSYDGVYLYNLPVASLTTEQTDIYQPSKYFEGLEPSTYTGSVTLQDGTRKTLTVPVAYNSKSGEYYLGDIERKIMVADFFAVMYESQLEFISSPDNSGWDQNHLITYANYIQAYDFYAGMGLKSVDGVGIPILLCVNYCDQNRTPVDNACYSGIYFGWACFGASQINRYGECLDVIGHEYTHGVTSHAMGGILYANETGAINEAYADIVGNICEMYMGGTSDTTWANAENSGAANRSLSDPHAFRQPAYVGDSYYVPNTYVPDVTFNDLGGVHLNNSLLSQVAYKLHEAGMSLEDQCSLWVTSISLLTPRLGYDAIYAALLMSLEINGLDMKYADTLENSFRDAGLLGDREQSYLSATRPGFGRLRFDTPESMTSQRSSAIVYDMFTQEMMSYSWPDPLGRVSMLLPAGNYLLQLRVASDTGEFFDYFYSSGDHWSQTSDAIVSATIVDGGNTTIANPE